MEHDTTILTSTWGNSQKFSLLVASAAILSGAMLNLSPKVRADEEHSQLYRMEDGHGPIKVSSLSMRLIHGYL